MATLAQWGFFSGLWLVGLVFDLTLATAFERVYRAVVARWLLRRHSQNVIANSMAIDAASSLSQEIGPATSEADGQPTKSSPQADTQIRDDYSRQRSASPMLGPQFIGSRRMS